MTKQSKKSKKPKGGSLHGVANLSPDSLNEKRDRRVYVLKGEDRDWAYWKLISEYQFVTAEMVSEMLKRDESTVRKRFLALYEANYINRVRRDELAPYVYFHGEKSCQEAATLGYLPEPRFIKSKSRLLIDHDLEITHFHRALAEATDKLSNWEQWRGDVKEDIETDEGIESLIPDAKFDLAGVDSRLEIVKSYESEYQAGTSNVVKKIGLYTLSDVDRVYFILPTKARVANLLAKIEQDFPVSHFWFTDEESYTRDILGKIWWTPRDFRDRTYSIFK